MGPGRFRSESGWLDKARLRVRKFYAKHFLDILDELFIPDAARYLNLSREMVYQMVQLGQLPVTRCGRAIRLDIKALDRWIERNTTGGMSL